VRGELVFGLTRHGATLSNGRRSVHRRFLREIAWLESFSFFGGSQNSLPGVNDSHAIKVILQDREGRYLAGNMTQAEFTDERAKARVFDYVQDRVREQIELLHKTHGTTWVAVRVDPREAYEICDLCGRRVMSFKALFDGTRFVCAECALRGTGTGGDSHT
jgi:hypothetical protein